MDSYPNIQRTFKIQQDNKQPGFQIHKISEQTSHQR